MTAQPQAEQGVEVLVPAEPVDDGRLGGPVGCCPFGRCPFGRCPF